MRSIIETLYSTVGREALCPSGELQAVYCQLYELVDHIPAETARLDELRERLLDAVAEKRAFAAGFRCAAALREECVSSLCRR